MGYRPVRRAGSHVKLRYEHPETDEVRVVTVPLTDADHISQDTYRSIARQCVRRSSKRGSSGCETSAECVRAQRQTTGVPPSANRRNESASRGVPS
ncbi:type II toxin-antitoxin system HicA family toxin [Salinirubellus salinus]|uniref:Type II toxin-antitoxin system HicA family toxin n=1 Tax=Salinirubellus salinus TaxID=1364945 RepID=A0A9E7UD32_9EURY|nr:type II toxin-antitoxin system HicA family toxin [Salinirubellus salinus]UWM56898.1 type II toxin-antitoxin system HicA family toxin [Salinirubellus salinus]